VTGVFSATSRGYQVEALVYRCSQIGDLGLPGMQGVLEFPDIRPESIGSPLQKWDLIVVVVQSMEALLEVV
jgi:hypothetical protein